MNLSLAALKLSLLGFVASVPLGPVSFLIFRSALHNGFRRAFITGLGAATADGFLAFAALWGLQGLELFFKTYHRSCQIAAGIFMVAMGLGLFLRPPQREKPLQTYGKSLLGFGTGFVVTLLNPLTLAAFVLSLSLLCLTDGKKSLPDFWGAFWVFAGALVWWTLLALGGVWGRRQFSVEKMTQLTQVLCCGLMLFGGVLMAQAVWFSSSTSLKLEPSVEKAQGL